jgi:DNA-binding transcriptional ArsR family regulator
MPVDAPTTRDAIAQTVALMRVLSDATRVRLLGLLQSGELNVTTLCQRLDLAQPTVSHHLALLRQARLVTARRSGKQVFYALNTDRVSNLDERGGVTIASGPVEVRLCNSPREGCGPVADDVGMAPVETVADCS